MKQKILTQMIMMFIASLAFVAALTWNEAVQSIFEELNFFQDKKIFVRFMYAITVTLIAIFVSTFLSNLVKDEQKIERNKQISPYDQS